jgi:flagellar protein FlaG
MNVMPVSANMEIKSAGEPSVQPAGPRRSEPPAPQNAQGQAAELSNEQVAKLVQEMAEHLGSVNLSINFSTYGKNNERVAITLTDKETGQVIREIPPKELQHLYVKMNELIGIIFNHTA